MYSLKQISEDAWIITLGHNARTFYLGPKGFTEDWDAKTFFAYQFAVRELNSLVTGAVYNGAGSGAMPDYRDLVWTEESSKNKTDDTGPR